MKNQKMPYKNKFLNNLLRVLILLIVVTYIINPFFNDKLNILLFIFSVTLMFLGFPVMNNGYRIPTVVFLIAGVFLLISFSQPVSALVNGAVSMANLVSIVVVMQLFSVPVDVGDYGPAIERLIVRYAKKEKHLFLIVSLVSCMFGSFLLLGIIPVILALLKPTIDKNVQDNTRFAATSILRGYNAALFWAPGAVVVLLTLQATNTRWTQIFPFGFLMCVLALCTANIFEKKLVLRDRPIRSVTDSNYINALPGERKAWFRMSEILLVVTGIIIGIYLLDTFTSLSITHCVVITGVVIFLIWMFSLRKKSGKAQAMAGYWKTGILKSTDLVTMFVGLGIFAEAVKVSGIIEYFLPFLSDVISYKFLFLALLPAVIILLSLVGIHCFISIAIIGNLLSAVPLPYSMLPVVAAILTGSVMAFSVSPFAGSTLTMSKFLDCSSIDVAVRWNGLYIAILYIEAVLLIWLFSFTC